MGNALLCATALMRGLTWLRDESASVQSYSVRNTLIPKRCAVVPMDAYEPPAHGLGRQFAAAIHRKLSEQRLNVVANRLPGRAA